LCDTRIPELAHSGADGRFEVTEVGALDGDLGGDDDLPTGNGGLHVVALHGRLTLGAHHP